MLTRSLATFAAASLCAFALASPQSSTATPSSARFGKALGTWQLPLPAQNGYVDGYLYELTPATTPAFHFSATLAAGPVLCPACVAGSIQGTLDDGVGPGPDYFVVGYYSGTSFNGAGTFSARIFAPTSAAPRGYIAGQFSNPPLLPVLGHFNARWALR